MTMRGYRSAMAVLIVCSAAAFCASADSAKEYDFIQTNRNVALFANLSDLAYVGLRVVFASEVTPMQAFGIGTTLELTSDKAGILAYDGTIPPRSTFEIDWTLDGPRIVAAYWIDADGLETSIDIHSPHAKMQYVVPRVLDESRRNCGPHLPIDVEFSGRWSKDPDGLPLARYQWIWSDGIVLEGESVRRMFRVPGTYTVTLTVWDAEGLLHSATNSFDIYPCCCSGP